ncbi:hypothetical protein ACGF13_02290 [Kitasatospora sp. NPDC048286]|uniref:hypothetical protein n=1 Tax=unclassified Kitasatospora TaxID=2633591 RepID=UPI003712171F
MLTIGSLALGVCDMSRAVAFRTAALDYVPRGGLVGDDWTVLACPDGNRFCVIDTSRS